MEHGAEKLKRWRFTIADLFFGVCGLCISCQAVRVALTESFDESDKILQVAMILLGTFTFGATLGALVAKAVVGTDATSKGFLIGGLIAVGVPSIAAVCAILVAASYILIGIMQSIIS